MNYYSMLGVSEKADTRQIKTAFRKLSRECHPDLNPDDPDAESRFKQINEAYSTLSDPTKRQQYNMQLYPPPASSHRREPFGLNIEDMFNQFFNARRQPVPPPPHPPTTSREKTINFQLPLSKLLDAKSVTTHVRFNEEEVCDSCKGVGGEQILQCQECRGHGHIQDVKQGQNIVITNSRPCMPCRGRGRSILSPCAECAGVGTVVNIKRYEITLNCKQV